MVRPLLHAGAIAGLIAITLLVAVIGGYAYYMPETQKERGLNVGIARQAVEQMETLESHVVLFAPGEAVPADMVGHLAMDFDRLERLLRTDAMQMTQLNRLRGMLGDGATAGALAATLAEMIAQERVSLAGHVTQWEEAALHTRLALIAATLVLYGFILFVYVVMRREARLRQQLFDTEQQRAQMQQEITERLSQVVTIQRAVTGARMNLEAVMQVITERTQEISGADAAVVEIIESGEMVYRAASGTAESHKGTRMPVKGSLSGMCLKENRALLCRDAETDNRVNKEICRKVGLRSMVAVPLVHNDMPVGVLKVASARPDAFGPEHVATLEMMAEVLSSTLSDAAATDALTAANEMLTEANSMLQELATSDGLTGIKNKRFFLMRLTEELARAARYKTPLSLILIDVDNFKQFNDSYGHVAGDVVLKKMAEILMRMSRNNDCVARFGGEEFALILPHADEGGALVLAERLRQVVEDTAWDQRDIHVSVGVSTLGDAVDTPERLIDAADKALYYSKQQGRNRVTHIAEMQAGLAPA